MWWKPFSSPQDLNTLHQAWKNPDTVIVNEPWWTATAQRADIVFPSTTSYEREDIGKANGGDNYIFICQSLSILLANQKMIIKFF